MTAPTPGRRRFASRRGLVGEIVDRSPFTPAPTPDLDYDTIWEAGRADGYEAGRDEFAHALAAVTSNRDYWLSQSARLSGELIAAEDEATAARQMLADAPHGRDCLSFYDETTRPGTRHRCTCWKAGL